MPTKYIINCMCAKCLKAVQFWNFYYWRDVLSYTKEGETYTFQLLFQIISLSLSFLLSNLFTLSFLSQYFEQAFYQTLELHTIFFIFSQNQSNGS